MAPTRESLVRVPERVVRQLERIAERGEQTTETFLGATISHMVRAMLDGPASRRGLEERVGDDSAGPAGYL